MKKTYSSAGLALTACLGFAGAASAADVYSPISAKDPPYVPVYTWTGFYLGANVGAGVGSHSLYNGQSNGPEYNDVPNGGSGFASGTTEGILGGGQIGYNYQAGRFVIGVEGEIEDSGVEGHIHGQSFGGTGDVNITGDYVATLTGRLGAVFQNDTLFYVKGGVAWDEFKYKVSMVNPGESGIFPSVTDGRTGWVLGFGAEYAITHQWTVKFEYEYMDFGSKTVSFPQGTGFESLTSPFSVTSDHTLNVVKAGINYKLGGAYENVPLK